MDLPPGYRFHPTDEELVAFYLKRKVLGRPFKYDDHIAVIDLYKQEPWDLPAKSIHYGSDMEWYFFSPRDKKYPNGLRTNRATEAGYWKATGKDRNVKKMGRVVGMKKTLVFYRGRAPHGERTDWVMHEYRLDEEECEKVHASQDLFVLCRVFKKSGVGPRSGEDRGPQTYLDDDNDNEPSGTLAEAGKSAVGPESTPILAVEPPPLETPRNVRVESCAVPASSLSVEDYGLGEAAGDVIDVGYLENYILDEPTFAPNEVPWDCLSSITAGMDLPSAESDGSEPFSASEFMVEWSADAETPILSGMMWNSDLSGSSQLQQHVQQDFLSGGVGSQLEMDSLQLELLESDDVLPPLEDELEPSDPYDSEASAVAHNFGEDACGGRTAARARERAPRHQPTSEEAQQRARSSNDGLNRPEATPQPRMSNTNFRVPEVPSQARGGSAGLNVTRPTLEASAPNNFHTNQHPSSSDYASSASTPGFDASRIPAGDNNPYSFQDNFFDFALDGELINFATDDGWSSGAPHEVVGDQGGPGSLVPPHPDKSAEHAKGAVSEGPLRFSSTPQGGPSEEKKPLSKPLAGLLRLLGSLQAKPASAAECPPDTKPLQTNAEVGSTYSSIHVSAVTVTCTSSADGAQKVEAAVSDCHLEGDARGVYQHVVSGSWQAIPVEKGAAQQGSDEQTPVCALCDTAAASGVLRRRVARGSSSGFVFVFVLGAMSALCWFLLLRGMWRLVSHVSTFIF